MRYAELKAYRTESFSFINSATPNTKMELENKISYNVGYSPNNTCRGEMKAEISDRNAPDKFRIEIVMSAIFSTAPDAEKEKLHLETYDMLFPYVKAFISSFTAQAGIPPVMLPYADISKQSIYRFEMPKKPFDGGDE